MAVTFFAALARMKYIDRWALMRASRRENLSEHAAEVAILAHALCEIGNLRHGRQLNAERAAVIGLFHDASEIITGDMPTPVKYGSAALREAYHAAEERATESLLARLPKDLAVVYAPLLGIVTAAEEGGAEELYLWRLVKAADKLSAYIKCLEEESAGNTEFRTAKKTIEAELEKLAGELPELRDFMENCLPPYGNTLDELSVQGDWDEKKHTETALDAEA
ncbi:5'-deoxynucleotidase [Stomatobaculum longum]|uniref:5'-deoxynucleotidase n=1 Tax=Stomatobaculum longum TaxID=796942 RepID=UPI002803C5A1|nr:5'-deoxynucleotidase [Stomatobaculum longum]